MTLPMKEPDRKEIVENVLTLDINQFKDYIQIGNRCTFTWRYRNGRFGKLETREIAIEVHEERFKFNYSQGEKNYWYWVGYTCTPCNFGGERAWFLCPACDERKGKLHLKNSYFACRECHDLTYYSCRKSGNELATVDNAMEKVARRLKIRDFKPWDHNRVLFKPKGMHETTFQMLSIKMMILDEQRAQAWLKNF
jgi:hypothetical protein